MGCCNGVTGIGKRKSLFIMLLMTGSFMVTELIVGYCGESLTLVADSFHMLSDVAALLVAFLSINLASKTWSRSTFGWARAEVLGALVNAVFLIALCFSILIEAFKRFAHPEPVLEPRWVFGVGVLGLLINLIGLGLFKGHAHSHAPHESHSHSNESNNSKKYPIVLQAAENGTIVTGGAEKKKSLNASQMNMKGVFLHVLADTMASVAVIISAGVVWATEDLRKEDYQCWNFIDYIDPSLCILICCLILISTWPLLQQASLILLQALPEDICADEVKRNLASIDGVMSVHDLHIWQVTGSKLCVSTHLKCKDMKDYERITREATKVFRGHAIYSCTIQGECDETSTVRIIDETANNNAWTEECLTNPNGSLSIPNYAKPDFAKSESP